MSYFNKIRICDCAEYIQDLCRAFNTMTREQVIARVHTDLNKMNISTKVHDGLLDTILHSKDQLGENGTWLMHQCLAFLQSKTKDTEYPKKNMLQIHKYKYITLWSFIYSYLGITKDSGYDYWLLCYMDTHGLVEHGGGLRCAYLSDTCTETYITDELEKAFDMWAREAPDELDD